MVRIIFVFLKLLSELTQKSTVSLSALPWDEQQPVSYFENKDKRGSWHGEDRFPWLDCCRVIDPSNGRLATAACFGGSTRVSRREWRHRGTSRLTPQRQRVAVPVHARPGSLCTERRHVDAVAGQTLYECVCVCVGMTAHTFLFGFRFQWQTSHAGRLL